MRKHFRTHVIRNICCGLALVLGWSLFPYRVFATDLIHPLAGSPNRWQFRVTFKDQTTSHTHQALGSSAVFCEVSPDTLTIRDIAFQNVSPILILGTGGPYLSMTTLTVRPDREKFIPLIIPAGQTVTHSVKFQLRGNLNGYLSSNFQTPVIYELTLPITFTLSRFTTIAGLPSYTLAMSGDLPTPLDINIPWLDTNLTVAAGGFNVTFGPPNQGSRINIVDYLLGRNDLDTNGLIQADMNGDNIIDISDDIWRKTH